MKKLNGCISEGYAEVDGKEFEVETLEEFITLLTNNKQVHINYFDDEEELDLWIDIKP